MNSNELKYLQEKLQQRNARVTGIWVNIKTIFFTVITVIGLLASLLLLPVAIVLFGGIIAFIFYKLRFTDPDR
tara:strand:- start:334 stop:552 length:219 start_codon:yes stop_codon:yes gene_type:complete